MERGYLVKIDATLGNAVNMRGWTGRGWYYVKKANGLEDFTAAQFIDLKYASVIIR